MFDATETKLDTVLKQISDNLMSDYSLQELYPAFSELCGYDKTIVGIDQFIDDPDYLGKVTTYPDGAKIIFPVWREILRDIYPNPFYSPYYEVILTGGIGIGKSTIGLIGLAYDLYRVLGLRAPQAQYKLLPTSTIDFVFINITYKLVKAVLFGKFMEWMNTSPYFRNQRMMAIGAKSNNMFPKKINLLTGSRSSDVIGHDVFAAILDELNFQNVVMNQAMDNYMGIQRRIKSRFMDCRGKVPGKIWLISSRKSGDDFLEDHIIKSKGKITTKVVEMPQWEALKHKISYSGKTFPVFIGDDTTEPRVISDSKTMNIYSSDLIIEVPLEYYGEFQGEIVKALQDIAGVSIRAGGRFIAQTQKIESQCNGANFFSKEIIQLDFKNQYERLIDYIVGDIFSNLRDPFCPRFLHIDIALTGDRLGIASSYIFSHVDTVKFDTVTGQKTATPEPFFMTEFCLGIECKPGQEIPIYKIRNFMVDLISAGYSIGKVSCDGYQSRHLLQEIELLGIPQQLLSLDRTTDGFEYYKRCMYENRAIAPNHSLLKKELRNLIRGAKKIDHPMKFPDGTKGSKDVIDAVAGSVYLANLMRLKDGILFS